MTRQSIITALKSNKESLIIARKLGDEESQKRLSQEKEQLKGALSSRCRECDSPLAPRTSRDPWIRFCMMHRPYMLANKMKKWLATAAACVCLALLAHAAPSGNSMSKAFGFTQSTSPGLVANIVYWGTVPGVYPNSSNIGLTTSFVLTGLTKNTTYYLAVTVVDTNGFESDYSVGLVYSTPKNPNAPTNLGPQ